MAVVEAGLGWAEQPGWQGPVLSTRKALIQKTRSPGEQRQQYAKKKIEKKNPTWKQQNNPQKPPKKSVDDCQLHSRLPDSLRVFQQSYWKSYSIISSSLISSAGEEWILTCKRLSTMGNKLIISNQIFHIARGGGELISDRSRISPQPVNPFAPAGKHSHSHCPGHTLFSWLCCLTNVQRSASFSSSLLHQLCKYSFNFK